MRKPCSILLLCVLLGFGVSLVVPAEDAAETAYDESETLPYESTPQVSIVVSLRAARTIHAVPDSSRHELSAPSEFPSARVGDTDVNRPANTRISLALLRTLLC